MSCAQRTLRRKRNQPGPFGAPSFSLEKTFQNLFNSTQNNLYTLNRLAYITDVRCVLTDTKLTSRSVLRIQGIELRDISKKGPSGFATRNGVDVTTLKVDDTDKGLVLYNPATNEVVVSLRDGDDRPSFVG